MRRAALLFILVVVGVALGRLIREAPRPTLDVQFGSEVPQGVTDMNGDLPNGSELVMVYLGTPTCGYCTRPEMAPMVRDAAATLRATAMEEGVHFVTVGVSANWVPGQGWRFLDDIMDFDEVVIGRSWLNSEVVALGWDHPGVDVVTPQIIVYRQSVVAPSDSTRGSISREAPLVRVSGLPVIQRWVDAGCPLEWRNQGGLPAGFESM